MTPGWRVSMRALVAVMAGFTGLAGGQLASAETTASPEPAAAASSIVPVPVSVQTVAGQPFAVTASTRIVARGESATAVATYLARILRRSTGFRLPVSDEASEER